MKPIKLKRDGRRWTVHVNGIPVVHIADGKGVTFDRGAAGLKVPRGFTPPPPEAQIARFPSQDAAKGIAHQIGRYILGMGDFLTSYTEIEW